MKFKALRTKKELKEFVHFETYEGLPIMFTSDLPTPMPITATTEGLKKYYASEHAVFPEEADLDKLELVEFEYNEISCEKF